MENPREPGVDMDQTDGDHLRPIVQPDRLAGMDQPGRIRPETNSIDLAIGSEIRAV